MVIAGPLGTATFWNQIFAKLEWPDVWISGSTCTEEMGKRAADALIQLLEKYSREVSCHPSS